MLRALRGLFFLVDMLQTLSGPFSMVDMLPGSPLSGHLPFVAFFLSGPLSISLVVFAYPVLSLRLVDPCRLLVSRLLVGSFLCFLDHSRFGRLLGLHGAYAFMPLCPSIVVAAYCDSLLFRFLFKNPLLWW
jgi:hypothetical protein